MRTLIIIALSFGMNSAARAEEPFGIRPQAGVRATRNTASAPQSQAGRLIAVEVVIADVVGEAKEMTTEQLAELEKAGNVTSLSRLHLSALENNPSVVQFGERVSLVTGRTSFGGRGSQDMLSQENLGTMVSVTARVEPDQSIVMELNAELTRLAPVAPRPEGENADRPVELPRTNTLTTKSTLRIPPGKSVVAGGKTAKTEHGTTQTWILVSAAVQAGAPDEAAVLKIMSLKHAKADALATLLTGLLRGEDYRIAVDARTNRLIVSGTPGVLERIVPLIAELDQAADESAK
jgi:type II secretory pathway component GspD/PulD (secretin)